MSESGISSPGGVMPLELASLARMVPVGQAFRDMLSRQPTPDQLARRAHRHLAAERLSRIVLAEHARTLADARVAVRPFLEMHGPKYIAGSEIEGASCYGCDRYDTWGDEPAFPCSTYRLALRMMTP